MADSLPIEIVDAAVARLNGGGFSQTFSAARVYDAKAELTDLGTLHVDAALREEGGSLLSRGSSLNQVAVDVAIRQRFPRATTDVSAVCDPLMLLKQELLDAFLGKTLTTYSCGEAFCDAWECRPAYFVDHIRRFGQFTAVLTLRFRLGRALP